VIRLIIIYILREIVEASTPLYFNYSNISLMMATNINRTETEKK